MSDREPSAQSGTIKTDVAREAAGTAVIGQPATALNAAPSDFPHPVIFFDGVCGLCNRFVDFVLRRDPGGLFQFSPLQGETAAERLAPGDITDLKTVVVVDGNRTYRKSAAVIWVLQRLGGIWRVASALFWLVPRPLRDLGYSWIANNRYAIFGKKETCRLPSVDERSRFLP
jgi:predicted DCC family thiol-disulfide oxidoreductase YuxK